MHKNVGRKWSWGGEGSQCTCNLFLVFMHACKNVFFLIGLEMLLFLYIYIYFNDLNVEMYVEM